MEDFKLSLSGNAINSALTKAANAGLTLLWTNPNPTTAVAVGSSLSVGDCSGYDFVIVVASTYEELATDRPYYAAISFCTLNYGVNLYCYINDSRYRYMQWTSTSTLKTLACNHTDSCIPYQIYGVKL